MNIAILGVAQADAHSAEAIDKARELGVTSAARRLGMVDHNHWIYAQTGRRQAAQSPVRPVVIAVLAPDHPPGPALSQGPPRTPATP